MNTVLTIHSPAELPMLLALDTPDLCRLCQRSDTKMAHAALTELCNWWLAEAQRETWQVGTLVEGKQRPDRQASDALFKLQIPGRVSPVPVFLVISQHWEKKEHPHYQLSVPFLKGLNAAAGSADLDAAVAPLVEAADAGMESLRHDGRNISLHRPLGSAGVNVVQKVVSKLVTGLVPLNWT